ncbi:hypothetical protein ACQKP0_24660 [Heyndrickxia sp. NPDC080065]|uniref:hypothetical protein n=1 Tax=Heyndrickxia sp. NPDC080065 TaxID=3390568 RepID=UPI003D04D83E
MKTILYGNGITIQFGGKDYFNDRIIKRAINNINTKSFPSEIYPREVKDWILLLHEKIPLIIKGYYDNYANTTEMRNSLVHFKNRYKTISNKTKVHEIGFEDYFLVHFLVCGKENIVNPERYHMTESLRCFFIDSIYNKGKIQTLYEKFPKEFVAFVNEFDNIFTTNYDWNIEKAIGRNVEYIHGSFHHLAEVYDPNSFRNMLSDSPIKEAVFIDGYEYLYSNALTSYSGNNKKFVLDMGLQANIAMDKFAKGLEENPELWNEVETWKDVDNPILRNLYESIKLKTKDKKLEFKENNSLKIFSEIEGDLSIIGLSPYNDNHIFEAILNNKKLSKIEFYYFDISETKLVTSILLEKNIHFKDVREFWNKFS